MNLKELWIYLSDKPNKRELIDELEAKGEISVLTALDAHSHLDDIANETYKRMREDEI